MSQEAASTENKWSKNGFGDPVVRNIGKFSPQESETVRRAVEEYCTVKEISTARLCSECDHKAELKGAWMEIAKRTPHRSVQSVYRHGLRQLHPFKRGPWTEAECQTLTELIARMGKKWSAIQTKLNRSADSCRDKYREMSNEFVKGRWKEPETELLKRLIREHLRADPNADIKELGKMVQEEDINVPWTAISKKMGKRSRLSCFKKWQKLTGLVSPSDLPPPKKMVEQEEDLDTYLLTEVVNSAANGEMDWNAIRGIPEPQARWETLLQDYEAAEVDAAAVLEKLTLVQMAQLLLERKQVSGDAKLAAATVEAVDLPPLPITESRAV
jgi:hypothetical protein